MTQWFRRSLSVKVVGGTLACLLLASLLTGTYNLRAERRDHLEHMRTLGAALSNSAAVFCVQPLLVGDYAVIEGYLTDLVHQNGDIAEVVVERSDGVIVCKSAGAA